MRRTLLITMMVSILTLLSIGITQAAVGDGACIDFIDSEQTLCGQNYVDSSEGFGAVELCGDCYACGANDGICPEDFNVDSTRGNCYNCPDPDCLVTIQGNVTTGSGVGKNGVTITAIIPHINNMGLTYSDVTAQHPTTNTPGYYNFQAPRGNYDFSISGPGIDTFVIPFEEATPNPEITISDTYDLTFPAEGNDCYSDCTGFINGGNYCKESCLGYADDKGTCAPQTALGYTQEQILRACQDARATNGTIVKLARSGDTVTLVQCCGNTGAPYTVTWPQRRFSEQSINASNVLVKSVVAEMRNIPSLVKLNLVIYN